jgi:predicted O-methyltransferase YrrM
MSDGEYRLCESYDGMSVGAILARAAPPQEARAMLVNQKPVTEPKHGDEYVPRALFSHPRRFHGRYLVNGIDHNTNEVDLAQMHHIAHLAAVSALRRHGTRVPLRFVELGVWCGESSLMMALAVLDAARLMGATGVECELYLIDHFTGTLGEATEYAVQAYGGSLEDMVRDNLAPVCSRLDDPPTQPVKFDLMVINGDSADSAALVPNDIDYCFVDADHTYPGCKRDLEAWWPKMGRGSIIAGHDYSKWFPGTVVAVDEVCERLGKVRPLLSENSAVWWSRIP